MCSKSLGILDQHTGLRPAADANHDRHWGRKAKCAWTCNDQNRHCGNETIGKSRFRPPNHPGTKRQKRDRDYGWDEPTRHPVCHSLDWRAASLRFRDELHDLGQHRVASNLPSLDHEGTRLIYRATDDGRLNLLCDGHRFACHHRLVDGASAFDDKTVDRHFFTWTNAQPIANVHLIERYLLLNTTIAQAAGRLRRKVEKRANGATGAFARPELQNLTEEHKHGDDGGSLEVNGDGSVADLKRFREQSWRKRGAARLKNLWLS